ncbi:hypothetical protein JD844_007582 [Phrynosoma platyrhinos]|uniref:Uncharacterized protein n=1 Tax=Phrynosoma platyrhinos TaxID=52577 RepID=A0ABQ7T354_PHRPL|nr:hypothetical protein JD844_007582 [Phrynosoma platyrhinos]
MTSTTPSNDNSWVIGLADMYLPFISFQDQYVLSLCGIVATIWFPVSAHRETMIMSFGYSLYTGWIGSTLALLGGCIIVCCSGDAQSFGENRYYASGSSSPTHAKSAHV